MAASLAAVLARHAGAASPPRAAESPVLNGLSLPAGTARSDLGGELIVSGMALRIQVFDAPAPLAATLATLAAGVAGPVDVLTLPDAVLVYGQAQGRQWLARLSAAGPARTRGTLSVLAHPDRLPEATGPALPAWAPAGLRLQIEAAEVSDAGTTWQRAYTHALPPRHLAAQLRASLRRAGWQDEPAGFSPGYGRWSRQGRSLSLVLGPLGTGTGLFTVETAP